MAPGHAGYTIWMGSRLVESELRMRSGYSRMQELLRGGIAHRFKKSFDFKMQCALFQKPVKIKKPTRFFVNSMSDLFHEKMLLQDLQELFGVMGSYPQHTFIILTKRHERLVELAPSLPWHDNIWMGVSIESQEYVVRAECLKQVPAKVPSIYRFKKVLAPEL
jgi:protein gp37